MYLDIRVPLYWNPNHTLDSAIPESVCSKPCQPGEYALQQELKCCWLCKKCRENERVLNGTGCEICPPLTWPDDKTFDICINIDATYLQFNQPLPLVVLVICVLGMICCWLIIFVYFHNWNERLIKGKTKKNKYSVTIIPIIIFTFKATSRELSLVTMLGVILNYVTAICIVSKPHSGNCYVSRIGFHVGLAVCYGPLLSKTSRIYRIFESAKKGKQKPKLISNRAVIVLAIILIIFQVSTNIIPK